MTSELCVDLIVCMIIFVICTDAIMGFLESDISGLPRGIISFALDSYLFIT
jgi:hypothetical protein